MGLKAYAIKPIIRFTKKYVKLRFAGCPPAIVGVLNASLTEVQFNAMGFLFNV